MKKKREFLKTARCSGKIGSFVMPTKEKLQINCVVLMTFQVSRWQPKIQKLVPVIYPTTQALEADKELPAECQTPPN